MAASSSSSEDYDSESSVELEQSNQSYDARPEQSESESDDGASEDDQSSDGDSEDEDTGETSLAELVKRQEEKGVNLRYRRQKKAEAVQLASERLHKARAAKQDEAPSVAAKKKKSKHAPTEVSSKRADFYKRKPDINDRGVGLEIGAHRYKPRDPRVSNLNGHLDMEHFDRNYEFLQEVREKEIALLRRKITAKQTTGKKGQHLRHKLGLTQEGSSSLEADKEELKRLMQQKADFERSQIDRAAKKAVKTKLREDVAEGRTGVYFPKRREMKRMQVEAKFEEIRKRGGDKAVDKVVAKRRKKNKSRDAGLLGGRLPVAR